MTSIIENCKYVFTNDELVEFARKQARHMGEMRQAEDEFDSVKADHKSKITRIETDITDCTRGVTAGYEMRTVKCLVLKFRPDQNSALVVRTDSGRVLRKRKLDADEKQMTISTSEPDAFAFEADFYEDTTSDVAQMVAEFVPLTDKEAEELRDSGIQLRPIRKQLEAPAA